MSLSGLDIARLIRYGEELGAEYVDVRVHEKIYELITLDNGVLREYSINRLRGVGVRVLVDGFMGYAATNVFDWEKIKNTVVEAVKNAKALSLHGSKTILYSRPSYKDKIISHYAIDALEIDPGEKIEVLKTIYDASREVKGVVSVTPRYGYEVDHRIIASSNGDYVDVTTRLIGVGAFIVSMVEGVSERLWDSRSNVAGWEFIKNLDIEDFASENAKLAVETAKAPVVKPGKYVAILDNEIVGLMLHEAFGHATEGDIVESGGSVLEGRIGEKVASEHVTIVDDGRVAGGYYVPYDDEGTAKKKVRTVDKGVLKTFLHSLSTAEKLGGEPTGNARAMTYAHPHLVRQTNTYMEPGDWKVDELFEDTGRGIYVRGKGAMGGEVDPAMGTFTFTAGPSYLIENGEPTKLVRGVMLSGFILETLKNVDAVANDLVVKTSVFGGCGKAGQLARVGDGGPHVRVREITIGGGG
ncbi:TldD/PmbA family protein [Staphylothermus hellenicus]|uniref:Peptidase U62 modulator of DNA gyrase n=1 Tax=Staphylothermus hellenicus (strain DSM 12710 / JCM 10830 / BK20S6-10-b1 / P8) TaxID=591019 RepID=D7D8G1_STAHD|nr:TldD/PmbA family protein [Staphylothermus hellenicus]ADI32057.1 peptidase U62 modulator of DNA gyrase [Staphylothermus hellenicus DSM 12710]